MKIIRQLKVPTGDIMVVDGESGKLEMLSIGDYGKEVNLNQNKPVTDGLPLLPLEEKWVVTVSTQTGCKSGCKFCDVPKVGPCHNATTGDLNGQILTALALHPEVTRTDRLNIHFARMGEPTWNDNVLWCARWAWRNLSGYNVHPVISTMMPWRNTKLEGFIKEWMYIKNEVYQGNAGLQLSINSTNETERKFMFGGSACTLQEISKIMNKVERPIGRKITLNFAVADYEVDTNELLRYFSPDDYICKLTPMHKTTTALKNDVKTIGDYTTPEPYMVMADNLRNSGYTVLVFIASRDEDEGRITCGNAILSGTLPHKYEEVI